MVSVYYDNNVRKLKDLFPLIKFDKFNTLDALWLKPSGHLSQLEISHIIKAFKPLICTLWFMTSGKGTVRINDYKRAFGEWRRLSKNVVSQVDIKRREIGEPDKYYSDICIVDNLSVGDLESFLSKCGSYFGVHSTITFLPEVNDLSIEKCGVRRLEKYWSEQLGKVFPLKERRQELVAYIESTSNLGGVAGLVCDDDIDGKSIYIFVGKGEVLEQVITKIMLNPNFDQIGETEFQRWLNYGFRLNRR